MSKSKCQLLLLSSFYSSSSSFSSYFSSSSSSFSSHRDNVQKKPQRPQKQQQQQQRNNESTVSPPPPTSSSLSTGTTILRKQLIVTNKYPNEYPTVSVGENGTFILVQFQQKPKTTATVPSSLSSSSPSSSSPSPLNKPIPSKFHAPWLWSNCPNAIHGTSGQRRRTPADYNGYKIKSAKIVSAVEVVASASPSARFKKAGNDNNEDKDNDKDNYNNNDQDEKRQQVQEEEEEEEEEEGKGKEEKDRSIILPCPGPPSDCAHPIGTIYNNNWNNEDAVREEEEARDKDKQRQGQPQRQQRQEKQQQKQLLLRITWASPRHESFPPLPSSSRYSYYDLNWLERWRYDADKINHRRKYTEVRQSVLKPVNNNDNGNDSVKVEEDGTTTKRGLGGIVTMDYNDIIRNSSSSPSSSSLSSPLVDDDDVFHLLRAIFSDGAVLIQNTPNHYEQQQHDEHNNNNIDQYVLSLANAISPSGSSHDTLYGETFHVQSNVNANNIAYTNLYLQPHQDLIYYEGAPGIQLLHCIDNGGDYIVGGQSILVDGLAAAYALRLLHPTYFNILSKIPATFVKQRPGVCMTYRRPHIVVENVGGGGGDDGIGGEIVAVNWSPPFEGPLYCPSESVELYYKAYRAFAHMVNIAAAASMSAEGGENDIKVQDEKEEEEEIMQMYTKYAIENTWEKRLMPGETLIFNNRRMLHGRRGFYCNKKEVDKEEYVQEAQSHRHLVGTYTCMDDTLSRYRNLKRRYNNRVYDYNLDYNNTIPNVGHGTVIVP